MSFLPSLGILTSKHSTDIIVLVETPFWEWRLEPQASRSTHRVASVYSDVHISDTSYMYLPCERQVSTISTFTEMFHIWQHLKSAAIFFLLI
jgi:hypothetical protein